jgi:hypothetical protein
LLSAASASAAARFQASLFEEVKQLGKDQQPEG